MNIYKDKRDESLTDEEEALVALAIDENYLLKSNLIDIHVLWVIRDALEKHIPKKPKDGTRAVIAGIDGANCGACGGLIFNPNEFCGKCGQAIDWGNEDE